MNAGTLRHLMTLQRYTTDRSSVGESTKSWSDVTTLWCSINSIRGKEYFDNKQMQGEITHKIKCRYYNDINIKDRLSFDSRIFKIEAIINVDERDITLEIMASEEI